MSYSRRQLYAMGEPLGDGATRREVGGKIIYGGGGGGDAPQPTTQITESGPTTESRTSTSSTKLPGYINANTENIVSKARTIGDTPYQAYTGQRVADFSPDMLTAMERMRTQGVAGEIDQASGLAGLAGQRASDYGMFQQGVQQYMNPYMQNVVDVERRKAQEAADRQSAQLSGQAAKMGAFGGSGAALQQRALTRDTAQQLSDIQSQGLNKAYESAANQYNTGITNMLSASGQLGGLGTTRFGQETDLIKNLGTSGDIQRQREQALLDVEYGDFGEKRDYAAKQLALQKALSSGLEYDTSTDSSSSSVSQPGKTVTQKIAAGGIVGGYAEGGITSLLSDQQIDQRQQMPNISDLARMSLQAEEMERARMRAAQQGIMPQRQPTVAAIERDRIAAIEGGIGGLDVPDDLVGSESMAGGGIVAFYEGNEVPAMDDEVARRAKVKQRNGMALTAEEILALQGADSAEPPIAPEVGGIAGMAREMSKFRPAGPQLGGITDQPPIEMESKLEDRSDKRGTSSSSGILDTIYGQQEGFLRDANARELAAQKEYREDLDKDNKETSDFAAKARQKIEQRMAGLEGEDKSALESSVLNFGLNLLATKGEKNMAKALAGAGLDTLSGHKQAMKELAAKRNRFEEALEKVDEFEYGERKGTAKDRRAAMLAYGKTEAALSKDLGDLFGAKGKDMFQLYRDGQSRAHAERMAKSRSTSSGLGADRLELSALNGLRISAAARLSAAQKGFDEDAIARASEDLAEVEQAIRAKTKMAAGPGVGGGKVAGSSTLPAGFKLD